jgi:hypothetical protein
MRLLSVFLALLNSLCAQPGQGPRTQAPASYQAEIEGTARNAKISGIVISDRLSVYCLNIPDWGTLEGKKVTVRGLVEYTEEFAAQINEKGEISQGTESGVLVIRKCEINKRAT